MPELIISLIISACVTLPGNRMRHGECNSCYDYLVNCTHDEVKKKSYAPGETEWVEAYTKCLDLWEKADKC